MTATSPEPSRASRFGNDREDTRYMAAARPAEVNPIDTIRPTYMMRSLLVAGMVIVADGSADASPT
jgi:hypothetical protein